LVPFRSFRVIRTGTTVRLALRLSGVRDKTAPWEQIVAFARRIESRVGARRPIEQQMGLDLANAVVEFDALMNQWKSELTTGTRSRARSDDDTQPR
jgi:hypothetical protein